MRLPDLISMTWRMVQGNRLRSFLTVLGGAVAVSLITFLVGLGYGLQQLTIGSIVHSQNLRSITVAPAPDSGADFSASTVSDFGKLNGAEKVVPVLMTNGTLKLGGRSGAVTVVAAAPDYLGMEGIGLASGKVYTDSAGLLLSDQVAALLGAKSAADLLGTSVTLLATDPDDDSKQVPLPAQTVVGTVPDEDSPVVYLPYALLNPAGAYLPTQVKLTARDDASVRSLAAAISDEGYQVDTLLDTLDQARTVFRWVTAGLLVFALVAVLVAAIGMFNTLTIALLERSRDFAILKTVGFRSRDVFSLFLAEAGLLGLGSGAAGVLLGLLGEWAVNLVLAAIVRRYGAEPFPLFSHPALFLPGAVLLPVLVALATGLLPARRASRTDPLQALRYE